MAKKKPTKAKASKAQKAELNPKQQDYVHGLTSTIKSNLKSGKYKKSTKQINVYKKDRKELTTDNRKLGWEKRKLRSELKKRLPAEAKEAIREALEDKDLESQKNRDKSAKLANQIQMAKGKPFFFEVDLSGFHKERWGKKRPVYRISSEQFKKKSPGEIEAQLLRAWRDTINEAIATEKRPKVIEGLKKLIKPVEQNILVAEGDESEASLEDEKYPILLDLDREQIDFFITGSK